MPKNTVSQDALLAAWQPAAPGKGKLFALDKCDTGAKPYSSGDKAKDKAKV